MSCCWMLVSCMLATALGYNLSRRVRYYSRYAFYFLYTLVSTVIFIPFMIPRGRDSRNGLIVSWMVRTCTRLFLGVTWKIRGLENVIPEGEGCVVTVNHQSCLDVALFTYLWQYIPNGYTIAKREVFWVYPFPWYWNTVFIDKLNPAQAKNEINKVGELVTTKKARICMFPEGTRHMGDTLLPFKKGAFHIALAAQCPIQPVVCSQYNFIDSKTYQFDSGHAIAEFLPPIPTKGMTKEQLPELMEKVQDAMQAAFTRLTAEQNSQQS